MSSTTGTGPVDRGRRLTSPAVVREILAREGVRPLHFLGQNFLVDANVLRIVTDAAELMHFDTVVEVGPGLGALTQALAEQSGRVYAIESDRHMVEALRRELAYAKNLVLVEADAASFDLETLWEGPRPEGVKMVSNLPYQIAATLLVEWLRGYAWLGEYTVMVQREVAERIAAAAGGRDYSSATVKIQYRAVVTRVANVSRNSFYPKPRVDSTILHLVRRPEGEGRDMPLAGDERFFDRVVTAAFSQRRKKLMNSIGGTIPGLSPRAVAMALADLGIHESARAEQLTPAEFAGLSDLLLNSAAPEVR
jgi:16S rRNA (adenine1518-N6/adenine1519-N6)-dimethyltransferase